MRRLTIATLASLALGLPLLAAPAQAAHHHRHHARHHRSMAYRGAATRPDLSGSAGTGTSMRDTTGAQTSIPSAISNQAPGAR